ncbi:Dihydroneopterin aldolase 2 [Zea mays]|uniref:Dihydroneopterin aldolase 2 n=1 Tax=Zea mays TaxID=4577 RepID=A0A1D6KMX3_MAIZE|nr:Dihydroneopterin aldolase 2 [Zea mays]
MRCCTHVVMGSQFNADGTAAITIIHARLLLVGN